MVQGERMGEKELVKKVSALRLGDVSKTVAERMREFRALRRKGNRDWFSELCFCILTANSTAKLGIKIQRELGANGFSTLSREGLTWALKRAGHRFYNTRARFILEARKFSNLKRIIKFDSTDRAREWLVKNVKGIGPKEASHFLRNVGHDDVAILDRHVLSLMREHGLIEQAPRTLGMKKYLEIEGRLKELAKKVAISLGELDLYLWYLKTGEVLK